MAKRTKKRKRNWPSSVPTPEPAASIVPQHRSAHDKFLLLARAFAILALGLFIYWPSLHGDWLWDDRDLIADNILIHDPDGLWKIWLQPAVMFDFLPIKISVEWIQWRLFGEDTLGYHLVSLGLHLISALLLWRFLHKFGLRYAWLGALIFTVHPTQVESVSWIAELKNTLSLPFFLLAMTAWLDFDARGKTKDYVLALVMFLLAMLTKPTMVMFPFVILLYAWWKRARIRERDGLASAPFFAVSFAIGLTTAVFLSHTAGEQHVVLGGPLSRIACAGLSLAFYFSKCVLPVDLMTAYPQWIVEPPSPVQFLPWPVIAGVLYFLWTKRKTWGRHALLGLGFFLLNLAPFIGLNAGSYMNYTWVMDHLLYIPMLGLIGLAVAAASHVATQLTVAGRRIELVIITIALMWMTWASHGYAALYQSLDALWSHTIALNPGADVAYNDLGVALSREGKTAEAVEQFRIAASLDPRYIDAHRNLAITLLHLGHPDQALPEFQATVALTPQLADAHANLADDYGALSRLPEAAAEYQQVIKIDPHFASAYNNLAITLFTLKHVDEALAAIQQGLIYNPDDATLQRDLSVLQAQKNGAVASPQKPPSP